VLRDGTSGANLEIIGVRAEDEQVNRVERS
jgi:hypothetical protein